MMKDRTILVRNVYYMLAYAFRTLHQREFADVAAEDFDNVHDLLAAILAKGLARQIKQGLHREYVPMYGELPALRGKLDVMGTADARMARRPVVACEYDELTEDNLINRVVKAACLTLARHGRVDLKRREELLKQARYLAGVGDIDLRAVSWGAIRLTRENQSYRLLLGTCELLAKGLLQTGEDGKVRLAEFVSDERMHWLYEHFILEYYRQEHHELKASAPQVPWALDDGQGSMLPVMQTDITLRRGTSTLIIDAKYYSHNTQGNHDVRTIHSANLYQIFAYVKNEQERLGPGHEVSGMLLYARTDEAIQPEGSYLMSGNRIEVRTLDLSKEFKEIATELDGIAKTILGIGA